MPRPAVLLALCLLPAFAQSPSAPRLDRMKADLAALTAPAMAGRLSLEPGSELAARYLAAEFRKAGLTPIIQDFRLAAYDTDPARRRLILTTAKATRVLGATGELAGGFRRDVTISAPVVFAGYGITAPEYHYDDYRHIDVTGKIVLLFDHEPQENNPASVFNGTGHTIHGARWMKVRNAERHGARAVLLASEPERTHRGLFDANPDAAPLRISAPAQSLEEAPGIPVVTLAPEALDAVLATAHRTPAELQRAIDRRLEPQSFEIPGLRAELRLANRTARSGVSSNVAALIPGTDPAETLLVTAHYDHLGVRHGQLYPGANDNASGTVAVLELARLFAAARPRRSILFVIFGSEEEMLLGSFHYTLHPLRPLAGTKAVLNLDMIARDEEAPAGTKNLLNLVGAAYAPELAALLERESRAAGITVDRKYDRDHTDHVLFRCDHYPFLTVNVPALWLFGGFHPGYHEPSDTMDRLNYEKLEKVTALAARALHLLAE